MSKTLNPVAWGHVEDALNDKERKPLLALLGGFLRGAKLDAVPPPVAADVSLPPSRVEIPSAMSAFVTAAHDARVLHAVGRSFRDLATLRTAALAHAPDVVATPRSGQELLDVLGWADAARYAVIPYGGGSSVVGGINAEGMDGYNGVVTLSLRALDRVLEVDARSAVVHAQAGILGPDLDAALKPHGLAVRHYPQSYLHSTLGGWVATRGAGHFSTQLAKIEDRVEALSVMLPDGRRVQTRALPASSVGVDPNRLWCGSEGALGVITDVRLRCVRLPTQRLSAGVRFKTYEQALEAARELVQGGILPTQLRILDPYEHMLSAAYSGKAAQGALMVLGFESAGAPLAETHAAALALTQKMGGEIKDDGGREAVGDWRSTFFRQPYLRDALLDYAVISDTFETAVPWSRLPQFYHAVREATARAVTQECGAGMVSCRTTHAYSDGCSLYFAFFGAGKRAELVEQWWRIKRAASAAVMACGGTISHHHAMGRDHRHWAREE
ncbi:MAG TPA: FAD-binding oxidoreductase, partial [Nevskiaceae bacterium]|nr:FAD-binding oxidoreductase [Nevskiaceae bacterium]